jgi:hypothetical protein
MRQQPQPQPQPQPTSGRSRRSTVATRRCRCLQTQWQPPPAVPAPQRGGTGLRTGAAAVMPAAGRASCQEPPHARPAAAAGSVAAARARPRNRRQHQHSRPPALRPLRSACRARWASCRPARSSRHSVQRARQARATVTLGWPAVRRASAPPLQQQQHRPQAPAARCAFWRGRPGWPAGPNSSSSSSQGAPAPLAAAAGCWGAAAAAMHSRTRTPITRLGTAATARWCAERRMGCAWALRLWAMASVT